MASQAGAIPLAAAPTPSLGERRLQAEWDLLQQLAALNPQRLAQPQGQESEFRVTLLATPALLADGTTTQPEHHLRIVYPRFFPSIPLELYLAQPVLHPNVHPLTGFVCLWDRHRISNTVEHALHKTVAILGWRLLNLEPRHVMQRAALALDAQVTASLLQTQPLTGIEHQADYRIEPKTSARRRLF